MSLASRAGRTVGVLILVEMVGGYLINFVLAAPLFGTPGFLVNAAPHATQIALSVLLGIALGALPVAIAVTAFPVFRRCADALAIWFLVLATVRFGAAVVEQVNVMSMVSLSQTYANATDKGPFQALRIVVAAPRNWSHYIGLIIGGSTLFLLYAVLFRFVLVPRVLAGFGLVAVLLQLVAVSMPLFGHEIVFPLLAPLGLSQLVLGLWLIVRGFRDGSA